MVLRIVRSRSDPYGGCRLEGSDQYCVLNQLPVLSPMNPDTSKWLLKMFDDEKLLERVARNELGLLQNAEVPYEA